MQWELLEHDGFPTTCSIKIDDFTICLIQYTGVSCDWYLFVSQGGKLFLKTRSLSTVDLSVAKYQAHQIIKEIVSQQAQYWTNILNHL